MLSTLWVYTIEAPLPLARPARGAGPTEGARPRSEEASMSIRYLYNLTLGLAAGFLVVATQAFAPFTVAWLTFAIAVGATVLALGTIPAPTGLIQRLLSAAAVVLGAWTIVASLVFTPATVVW